MNRFKQNPNGQAIVIIALLMIALLAITGLAIDGGGIFLLYRDAQNASDAAALSAAYALCTDGNVEQVGLSTARLNGFATNNDDTFVDVYNPPRALAYVGNAAYVQVVIEAIKPSYFIQIAYHEPLVVRVSSIMECSYDEAGYPQLRKWNE